MLVSNNRGFTLVELIFGIVLLAIVMTIVTSFIAPQARQSAEPLIQLKASELGQALLNEIMGKSFDELSERNPPFRRCGELGFVSCSAVLGKEAGETRITYNDVDDYIGNYSNANLVNSLNQSISDDYLGFSYNVSVVYDGDYDGVSDSDVNAKLITVVINASNGEQYGFSAYKGNY